ncbi:MAG TPA: Rieske (2Fe-2S) protein [Candidatus Binatia bacterium]|jgi:Rieske Fe-S protein|nr:Rieske (2Fe-2S) protein [Candidatus Binatia bacterium]
MNMSRRKFLIVAAGTGALAGCQTADNGGALTAPHGERVVNAGLASNFSADGVYGGFRDLGFFLVRKGEKLLAFSAICTHKKCKLIAEPDRSFYCKCHGSTFSPDGRVTRGPARRDLPVLTTFTDENAQLFVKVPIM